MKKIVSLLISVALLVSMTATPFAAPSYGSEWDGYYHNATTKYSDVDSSHWAYDAIMRSTEKNWFGGYPDGSFRPDGSITRAEALKVFVVFLGLELKEVTQSTFYDVNPREWYAPYIEAGKDLFPTHTTVQGKIPFQPDMPVTREDTVYALVKALGYDVGVKYVDESILNMFSDKNSISGGIKSHFAIALSNKLVSGFPDGTIRAQDSLTRAEFATLLYRGSFVGFSDAYEAVIESVSVTPSTIIEMTIGEVITLSARATYTDKTNQPYTKLSPYNANGSSAVVLNGATITAVKEGTAIIKYNDSYLKNESLTVTVRNPSDAPSLKITGYDEITDEEVMTITGVVTDKSGSVDLTRNGKDVAVNRDGSFATTVQLSIGTNSIQFVAKNIYGIEATKNISIERKERKAEIPTSTTKPSTSTTAKIELSTLPGDARGDKDVKEDPLYSSTVESDEGKVPYLTFDSGTGTITRCDADAVVINIPEKIGGVSVYNIGKGAFADCTNLEKVGFTSMLKEIKADAFRDCIRLSKVAIPEGVTAIGENAFDGCSSLTSVEIPVGVRKIADELFSGCRRLTAISLPEGIVTIGSKAFYCCKSLSEIELPESVTKIEGGAFSDCSGLKSIVISENVTTIAKDAFDGCDVTIRASADSYALEYAKANSMAWEAI